MINFEDKKLNIMNFLNEVALKYPNSISFASGRPKEEFFSLDSWSSYIEDFKSYLISEQGINRQQVENYIGQYGKTGGFINTLISKQVLNDDGIHCSASQIMVTNGCQEGMLILLMAYCKDKVLLVNDPTYIGMTGIASILGIECYSISNSHGCIEVASLENRIEEVLALSGKEVAAIYLIPDCDNPTGYSMTEEERYKTLEIARRRNIYIFEDDPYSMFDCRDEKPKSLFALDKFSVVFRLGSYSKTICPTLRIGYIIAPIYNKSEVNSNTIISNLSKIKSLISVNTSQFTQAIVGGLLIQNNNSLKSYIEPARKFYAENMCVMKSALDEAFRSMEGVSWNNPQGGFFLTLKVPFNVNDEHVEQCAQNYGVIFMPRSYFSISPKEDQYIRLSFSYVSPREIMQGIKNLKSFIESEVNTNE